MLEGSLVEAVQLGFDRAVAQLKVVNPGVDLCVERIHHLSDVEDGVIKPPPDFEEDVGHVDEARPNCNTLFLISGKRENTSDIFKK